MLVIPISIDLPSDISGAKAKTVLVEVRDTSLADAPSSLLAQRQLHDIQLIPNGHLETAISIPNKSPQQVLTVRVHVSMDGSGDIKPGDLLTTSYIEVPNNQMGHRLSAPVTRIK